MKVGKMKKKILVQTSHLVCNNITTNSIRTTGEMFGWRNEVTEIINNTNGNTIVLGHTHWGKKVGKHSSGHKSWNPKWKVAQPCLDFIYFYSDYHNTI